MNFVQKLWQTLKDTGKAFMEDNCVKLSASLSYYTVFAIGPLMVIIISLLGLFLGEADVQAKVFGQVSSLLGPDAATQFQQIVQNVNQSENSTIGTIIGSIILVVSATIIFTDIQDSINYIWAIRPKPKRGFLKLLKNRLLSFSLIVSLGFLLLVSLILSALMDMLSDRLMKILANSTVYIFYVLNFLIIFCLISLLFAVIFKVLPDGKIRWKDALIGSSFTALLFILGKAGISLYLGNSDLSVTYGAAASVILVLTWVYYTSIILYFGAEFTRVYALEFGGGIIPYKTAVFIVKREAKEVDFHGHLTEKEKKQVEKQAGNIQKQNDNGV